MIKISVIIPTHNRERMCKRAIASVVSQSYTNYEILVSNDSEEEYDIDGSYIFKHPKVNYFKKKSEGYDANYMFLAKKATGDYLYCLEDDDYLIDNHIFEDCVKLIENNQEVSIVMMNNTLDFKSILSKKTNFKEIYENYEFFEMFPEIMVSFQFSQAMFKTSLVKPIILEEVPKNLGSVNTDALIFLLVCLEKGKIGHLNRVGYMITVNGDNLSWNNYVNSFFGGNSYIQYVAKKAKHLKIDLRQWKEKMELNHITHLLKFLPEYLKGISNDKHS